MGSTALLVEKIAGSPTDDFFCSVFNKKVNLENGEFADLAGCVLISGKDQDAMRISASGIFELFVKKLEAGGEDLLELLTGAKESASSYLTGQPLETSFVFTVFFNSACYIVKFGNAVKIWVFDPPKSAEITFETGSGPVEDNQLYLIATAKFLENFKTDGFREKVDVDFGELVDGLATDISASFDQSELGAIFIRTKREEESIEIEGKEEDLVSESKERDETEDRGGSEFREMPEEQETKSFGIKTGNVKAIFSKILSDISLFRAGDKSIKAGLRSRVLLGGVIVVLILSVSLGAAVFRNNQEAREVEFSKHLTEATSKYNEGAALVGLNKERARRILVEAQSELAAAMVIKNDDAGAKRLEEDIKVKLKEAEVAGNISFETLVDVPTDVNSISFADKNIVASGGGVYIVDPSTKSFDEVKGPGQSVASTIYDNSLFLLGDDNVVKQDLLGAGAKAIDAPRGQDIGVFFGNIYVLSGRGIAKIVPIENGYAPAADYLNTKIDFPPSSRFAIDGSIWVTKGDSVLKFTRGAQEDFQIKGLSGMPGELGAIYTDANLEDLYILDRVNSALLVLDKDGVYKKSYQGSELASASDILVTDDGERLYLAIGEKVLWASIK